jgi:parallel beta-helix repeat protein
MHGWKCKRLSGVTAGSVVNFFVALCALAAPAPSLAAVYYVATTGADGSPGTLAQPWRTLQHAADVMAPGDTVLARGGTYAESVSLERGGLPGARLRFAAYPNETVILDGGGTLYAGFTTDANQDISDITIDGFTIRNFANFGVVAWSTNDRFTLTNLDIHDNRATGIRLSNSEGTLVQNVTLRNNLGGFDCTPILPGAPSDPGCTNLHIADTQAIDNGTGNDTAVDAFAVEKGTDILVERAVATGGPGDGFDFKSDRTTLSRVIASGARNNIKLWGSGSTLVNALAYNATADANLVLAGGGSYTITNVTIANMTGYAYLATIGDGGAATPVNLHNAIFFNDNPVMGGTLVYFDAGVTLTSDNNLYFNPYRTDAVVCASFPPYSDDCFSDADINRQTAHLWIEAASRYADPLFVNAPAADFSLRAGSPAIDAGTAANAPSTDLDGRARPQGAGVDVGAYEYGAVPPITYAVTGQIRYYSSAAPVGAAAVQLSGPAPATALTDATGQFALSGLTGGAWQVEPRKLGDAGAGISALDAAYVLQAAVGLRTLTPEQQLACDVSGNGTLSAYDAALILRYKVGLIAALPVAELCASDWAFLPAPAAAANQQVTPPQITAGACQPGRIAYQPLAGQADNQDFFAVLFGDCTGNWQPGPIHMP